MLSSELISSIIQKQKPQSYILVYVSMFRASFILVLKSFGKSCVNEHISSCKDCHSCFINNLLILAQVNRDYDGKIKSLYIKNNAQNETTKYIVIVFHYLSIS